MQASGIYVYIKILMSFFFSPPASVKRGNSAALEHFSLRHVSCSKQNQLINCRHHTISSQEELNGNLCDSYAQMENHWMLWTVSCYFYFYFVISWLLLTSVTLSMSYSQVGLLTTTFIKLCPDKVSFIPPVAWEENVKRTLLSNRIIER